MTLLDGDSIEDISAWVREYMAGIEKPRCINEPQPGLLPEPLGRHVYQGWSRNYDMMISDDISPTWSIDIT